MSALQTQTSRADDEQWMQRALEQAEQALAADEVPVGALLVLDNELIAAGHNQTITLADPSCPCRNAGAARGRQQAGQLPAAGSNTVCDAGAVSDVCRCHCSCACGACRVWRCRSQNRCCRWLF